MPNRILREGILTSESVNSLFPADEVFYRRLMSIVDDFGRYDARPSILRAVLYPLQLDRIREADIARGLAACEKASLVRCYEVEGKPYLEMARFGNNARAKSSKWPDPPGHARMCAQMRACAPETEYETVTGTEGETEHKRAHPSSGDFERWWSTYPKKVGKQAVLKAWRRADLPPVATLIAAVERQKGSEQWRRGFIPNPLTWINQGRWEDELPEPESESGLVATFDSDPDDPLLDEILRGDGDE